jgi:hypothetical protein
VPGEAIREEAREIVEERMAHGLEPDEAAFIVRRRLRHEVTKALVLPNNVVAPLGAVSDPQASVVGQAGQAAVAEHRAEDHLELDRIGRQPTESRMGMFDHTDDVDRRLRLSGRRYLEKRRRFPMSESVLSNRFTRSLNGKSDGETESLPTARTGCRDTHSFGIHVRANGSLGNT